MSQSRGSEMGLERLEAIHPDLIPGPVFRLRTDGTITFLNAAARSIFGDDVIGRSWLALWPRIDQEAWIRWLKGDGSLHHDEAVGDIALSFTLVHVPDTDAVLVCGADITELIQAEHTLAEQAAELRENALFPEMNPGPVFRLDLDAVVLRANRTAQAVFGAEVIGRRWLDLVPTISVAEWDRIAAGGHRSWVEAEVRDAVLGFTLARAAESRYVYVYGADISALKAAERQLQELALFPEMNPGPVLRVDRHGSVLLANRAARELFGMDDMVGWNWLSLCPGVPRRLLDQVLGRGETVGHEAIIGGRYILFTYTPGLGLEQIFVYGADLTALKETERALRQSERMATLGTLAAGVAHELNNPAAAVQRAAEHLADIFGRLQEAQLRLHQLTLGDELRGILADLSAEARTRAAALPVFDPITRSDREYEVERWLEDRDIGDGWELAPDLVSLGYSVSELDEFAERLPPQVLEPVIAWLSRTYAVYAILEEIHHGGAHISEIVTALKAYSYVDRAPVQAVDVNEGIRNTLIILQNKVKRGVKVELALDPALPRIEAYGGDLNQVWTNLIDNAVDAMGGGGRLALRSAGEEGWIRVEVEDDGPGIPPEIQGRIFDPFFTTKPPGQGTGLGLNTTFNIVVKKHGGRIEVQSEPGRTRFTVRLPQVLSAATPPAAEPSSTGVAE